jgi:hypothetical protein
MIVILSEAKDLTSLHARLPEPVHDETTQFTECDLEIFSADARSLAALGTTE